MGYKITPAELKQKWTDYCKKCDELYIEKMRYKDIIVEVPRRIIYCIDSFCYFAGIDEAELTELEKNGRFTQIIKRVRYGVLARKLEALVNREGSTPGLVFDLKCNYGLYAKKASDMAANGYKVTFVIDESADNETVQDDATEEQAVPPAAEEKREPEPDPYIPPPPFIQKPYDYANSIFVC